MKNSAVRLAVTMGVLLSILLPWSGAASAESNRERTFEPTPGVIHAPPLGNPVRDKVLRATPRALKRATTSAAENAYSAPDGSRIYITASDGYAPDPVADQTLANFLGSLLHGFELNGLRVYVATPPEIPALCGADVAACYLPTEQRMIIVGEDNFAGLPTDYVATHEYGHHIENHRSNRIFGLGALSWGTKAWASYEGVCPGALAGRYSPVINSDADYYRNPGEAFAEAFAYYHYPGAIPWEWDSSLQPNQGSFNQIVRDVQQPWPGPVRSLRRGRVSANGDEGDVFRFKAPLDGTLALDLYGPRRADFDIFLFRAHHNHIVKKSVGRGSREDIHYVICGGYKFDVVVLAYKGAGKYRLRIKKP